MIFSCVILISIFVPRFTSAIVGGEPGHFQEASKGVVLIDIGFGVYLPPYCAGALISSQFVLTNGRCCSHEFHRTTIHVGSTTPFETGQFYRLAAFEHIGSASSTDFQLCLILLEREVEFNAYCTSLALPTKSNMIEDKNQQLHAFGYGAVHLDPPTEQANLNFIFTRVLSNEMMAIEYPTLEDRYCVNVFGTPHSGTLKLTCHGYYWDRLKRLMLDDNGAPVVGSKDNVVYTILGTFAPLKEGLVWDDEAFPIYGIDVFSARDDILAGMGRLRRYPKKWQINYFTTQNWYFIFICLVGFSGWLDIWHLTTEIHGILRPDNWL